MSGKRKGTVIIGSSAEGNARVHFIDGSMAESTGVSETDVVNETGRAISEGQIISLVAGSPIVGTTVGSRGTGTVSQDGTKLTVIHSGDTGLSGTVNISSEYGTVGGWEGTSGVSFANVGGEAAYLSAG